MRSLEAQAGIHSGRLRLRFIVTGLVHELLIPGGRVPRFADGLWRHTCFECFTAAEGEAAYSEYNFSPSGEWAAYGFGGYRSEMTRLRIPDPAVSVRSGDDRLVVEASIPAPPHGARLRCALAAVMEQRDGSLSYWALAHCGGRPDFHRREGFILSL